MGGRGILKQLFGRRAEASWKGYAPATFVFAVFTLMGLHDGFPLLVMAVLLICIFQLYFRTFAGWLLLLVVCLWYGVKVAGSTDQIHGQYGEYVFFMACGFLPALALVIWRPRLTTQ